MVCGKFTTQSEGADMRRILTTAIVTTSLVVLHALPALAGYMNGSG